MMLEPELNPWYLHGLRAGQRAARAIYPNVIPPAPLGLGILDNYAWQSGWADGWSDTYCAEVEQ
jgi:hypothetical protein